MILPNKLERLVIVDFLDAAKGGHHLLYFDHPKADKSGHVYDSNGKIYKAQCEKNGAKHEISAFLSPIDQNKSLPEIEELLPHIRAFFESRRYKAAHKRGKIIHEYGDISDKREWPFILARQEAFHIGYFERHTKKPEGKLLFFIFPNHQEYKKIRKDILQYFGQFKRKKSRRKIR